MENKHSILIIVIVVVILIAVFVVWRMHSAQVDSRNSIHFKIQPLSPGFSDDY